MKLFSSFTINSYCSRFCSLKFCDSSKIDFSFICLSLFIEWRVSTISCRRWRRVTRVTREDLHWQKDSTNLLQHQLLVPVHIVLEYNCSHTDLECTPGTCTGLRRNIPAVLIRGSEVRGQATRPAYTHTLYWYNCTVPCSPVATGVKLGWYSVVPGTSTCTVEVTEGIQ